MRRLGAGTFGVPRVVAIPVAIGLLFGSAATVSAAEPAPQYVLDVFSCGLTDAEGNFVEGNVPAGSEIILFEGWIADTRGQLQSFVNNATWLLSVDGEPIDLTPYLSGILDLGPFWGDLWTVSAGTLASGETLHTHYNLYLKSSNFDGVVHWKKGLLHGDGIDCFVTAD